MRLKEGEIVSVSHYSKGNPFKTVVYLVDEDEITLKLTTEFSKYVIFEGDPIVVGFQSENNVYISECIIEKIHPGEGCVKVKAENTEFITDKRVYERFPVSLYAEARGENIKKRSVAYVKNISLEGLSVVSREEINEGQEIDFDIYIDGRVIVVTGVITRKTKNANNNEYGMKIIYKDFNTKNSLKLYLKILKDEQERVLKGIAEQHI